MAVLLVFVRSWLVVALDIKVDRLEVRVVFEVGCSVVCCVRRSLEYICSGGGGGDRRGCRCGL